METKKSRALILSNPIRLLSLKAQGPAGRCRLDAARAKLFGRTAPPAQGSGGGGIREGLLGS